MGLFKAVLTKFKLRNPEPKGWFRSMENNVRQASLTKLLRYEPLIESIRENNWKDTHNFLTNDGEALTAKINKEGETALHIAVRTIRSNDFIRKLIEMMPIYALGIVDEDGQTAFLLAVEKDNTEVVGFLLTKQPELLYIRCKNGKFPLQIAAQIGNRKMVSTLLLVTNDHTRHSPYGREDGQLLLRTLLEKKLYGAVTELLHRHPKMRGNRNEEIIFLLNKLIVTEPSPFFSRCSFSLMEHLLYFCVPTPQVPKFQSDEEGIKNQEKGHKDNEDGNSFIMKIQRVPYVKKKQEMKLMHQEAVKFVEWTCTQFTREDYKEIESAFKGPLISAAKRGIEEIVQQIFDFFPISIDDDRIEIMKSVVSERHAYIFKLKNHRSYFKQMAIDYKDNEGNNILHLAGQSNIENTKYVNRSSVFQILYELQWFKEMEKLVPPSYRDMKNSNERKTPEMIFVEAHKDLLTEGERRLKETATYCIAISAITGTFSFAAAVAVTINDIARDIFIFRGKAVMVFFFADVLSIISSYISLFMFLAILMSRYTHRDFHRTLPKRLIIAIAYLILSMISMIVASVAINYGTLMILVMVVGIAYLVFACINNVPVFLCSQWHVLGISTHFRLT